MFLFFSLISCFQCSFLIISILILILVLILILSIHFSSLLSSKKFVSYFVFGFFRVIAFIFSLIFIAFQFVKREECVFVFRCFLFVFELKRICIKRKKESLKIIYTNWSKLKNKKQVSKNEKQITNTKILKKQHQKKNWSILTKQKKEGLSKMIKQTKFFTNLLLSH